LEIIDDEVALITECGTVTCADIPQRTRFGGRNPTLLVRFFNGGQAEPSQTVPSLGSGNKRATENVNGSKTCP
jgi:hypothetical protein